MGLSSVVHGGHCATPPGLPSPGIRVGRSGPVGLVAEGRGVDLLLWADGLGCPFQQTGPVFRQLSDRASALTFIVLVLGVSLATARLLGGLILAVSPLLVTLLMLLVVTRDGWRREGWRRLGIGRL